MKRIFVGALFATQLMASDAAEQDQPNQIQFADIMARYRAVCTQAIKKRPAFEINKMNEINAQSHGAASIAAPPATSHSEE